MSPQLQPERLNGTVNTCLPAGSSSVPFYFHPPYGQHPYRHSPCLLAPRPVVPLGALPTNPSLPLLPVAPQPSQLSLCSPPLSRMEGCILFGEHFSHPFTDPLSTSVLHHSTPIPHHSTLIPSSSVIWEAACRVSNSTGWPALRFPPGAQDSDNLFAGGVNGIENAMAQTGQSGSGNM